MRSLSKVSTFNQQISAKSVGTRIKKPILNDIIYIFCNLKALIRIILRKMRKLEVLHGGRFNTFSNSVHPQRESNPRSQRLKGA